MSLTVIYVWISSQTIEKRGVFIWAKYNGFIIPDIPLAALPVK